MQKENLNPLSAKGALSFSAFLWTLLATVVVNLIVYAMIRGALIPARAALDVTRIVLLYAAWFVLASLGFIVVTNCFIKRWSDILSEKVIGSWLRSLIRFCLLSPVLSFPLTIITMLFFPQSPMNGVDDGGAKSGIVSFLVTCLVVTTLATGFLPGSYFGLERAQFRESIQPYLTEASSPVASKLPSDNLILPALAVVTPLIRYLSWIALDFIRIKTMSDSIASDSKTYCSEKLGYMRVEVPDCFFNQLRKMTTDAPLVVPYFALYFEMKYRKAATEQSSKTQTSMENFASSLLLVSNMLELLERGPIFINRTEMLKPSMLLHGFGSPELIMVEAGQDAQRLAILDKILPIIEMQMAAIRKFHADAGPGLGPDESAIVAELREIEIRIKAAQRAPL